VSGQLNVMLEGRVVATITNAPNDTNFVTIDRDFANDPNAPVLSFNAFRDPVTRAYRDAIRPTQTVVHPYFSNLLPEGPLRKYLAAHAHVKPVRDFPLLWLLGNDLPGALIMRDAAGAAIPPEEEEYDATGSDDVDPKMLRFSLAGVQLKFSASGDPERGLTIPVDGMGGSWIVKLPDQRFTGVPENEYSMMEFARAVGIDVPKIGLVTPAEIAGIPGDIQFSGNAYYIERFDRTSAGRIHTEDFAQANMLFPAQKYTHFNFDMLATQVADLMGSDAAMDLIRRIIFNIGIGNGDMHAKNWSVIYRDGHTPSLAPAYDYLSTIKYMPNENIGMNLADTKAFAQIDAMRITRLASHARLSTKLAERAAKDIVTRMRDVWPTIKDALPIDDEQRAAITAHMDSVPLFNGRAATGALPSLQRKAGGSRKLSASFTEMVQLIALEKADTFHGIVEAKTFPTTMVFVQVVVRNDGAPSIADNWSMWITVDGKDVKAEGVPVPDFTFRPDPSGPALSYTQDEAIYNVSVIRPITKEMPIRGFIIGRFELPSSVVTENLGTLRLRFTDAAGTSYESVKKARGRLRPGAEFVPGIGKITP
jgi:serine/threonine-protein kinase HipA